MSGREQAARIGALRGKPARAAAGARRGAEKLRPVLPRWMREKVREARAAGAAPSPPLFVRRIDVAEELWGRYAVQYSGMSDADLERKVNRDAHAIWEYRDHPGFEGCSTVLAMVEAFLSGSWCNGRDRGRIPPLRSEYQSARMRATPAHVLRHLWIMRPDLFDASTEQSLEQLQRNAKVPATLRMARLEHFGQDVVRAARAILERRESGLLLGPEGVGKSYLAAAMVAALVAEEGRPTARWANVPEVLLEIQSTYNAERGDASAALVIRRYTEPDVLVLDDYGAEKASDWASSTLYVLINNRVDAGRRTIVTSNLDPRAIEGHNGRIASRFRAFSRLALAGRDRRDRAAEEGGQLF